MRLYACCLPRLMMSSGNFESPTAHSQSGKGRPSLAPFGPPPRCNIPTGIPGTPPTRGRRRKKPPLSSRTMLARDTCAAPAVVGLGVGDIHTPLCYLFNALSPLQDVQKVPVFSRLALACQAFPPCMSPEVVPTHDSHTLRDKRTAVNSVYPRDVLPPYGTKLVLVEGPRCNRLREISRKYR